MVSADLLVMKCDCVETCAHDNNQHERTSRHTLKGCMSVQHNLLVDIRQLALHEQRSKTLTVQF
jgi:hypothetical protein